MQRLAFREEPAPMPNLDRMLELLRARRSAELEMLSWLGRNLPEHVVAEGLERFDEACRASDALIELQNQESDWWRWMYSRLHYVHCGVHVEEVGRRCGADLASVHVHGNVYDITEALAKKPAK